MRSPGPRRSVRLYSPLVQMSASHIWALDPLVLPSSGSGGPQTLPQPASLVHLLPGITSSFLRTKHQDPAEVATALAASSRGFTPAKSPVHLAPLPGSTVPSHQAGSGRPPLLAQSKCSKMLLRQRPQQTRFKSGLDLQGAFHHNSQLAIPAGGRSLSPAQRHTL